MDGLSPDRLLSPDSRDHHISTAQTEPLAYLVTFTCYGTWLHGDPRGSVDPEHNQWAAPCLSPDEYQELQDFSRLKHAPVVLGERQRAIVHRAIVEVCTHRHWRLHAVNVRTNHVHAVATADRPGKRVLSDFKSYATRRLKEADALPGACLHVRPRKGSESTFRLWTRGGSARPILEDDHFHRAVRCVLEGQGVDITREMAVRPRKDQEPRP